MARKGDPGDIVRINLGDGRHTYGQLLVDPFIAVYDFPTTDRVADLTAVVGRPVLFVIAVNHAAVGRCGWPVVGQAPPGSPAVAVPDRFVQDVADPADCRIVDVEGNARPATIGECEGLEPAAVWDAGHVAARLRDHYAGRPSVFLERLGLRHPGPGA
jgi:hypothetical protein